MSPAVFGALLIIPYCAEALGAGGAALTARRMSPAQQIAVGLVISLVGMWMLFAWVGSLTTPRFYMALMVMMFGLPWIFTTCSVHAMRQLEDKALASGVNMSLLLSSYAAMALLLTRVPIITEGVFLGMVSLSLTLSMLLFAWSYWKGSFHA